MEWLERMNRAIGYIEDNLEQDIDYDQIAKNCLMFGLPVSTHVLICT
ncbi:hypothetical protein ACFTAO_17570 [Paenibacillus rhizoplanae]